MLISDGNSVFELAAAVNLGASLVPSYLLGAAQRQLERVEVQRVVVRGLISEQKKVLVEDILSSAGFKSRTAIQETRSKENAVRNAALLFVVSCVLCLLVSALRPNLEVNDIIFVISSLVLLLGAVASLYLFTFRNVRGQLKNAEADLAEASRVLKSSI